MAKTPYERNKNAIKKYIAEKTDDIRVRAPKGTKEEWKAYAESKGISLNALEPVHIKIASKIIAKVRFPKYRTSSLS